ncbi:MAG: hypothetical protein WC373_01735 [Smithella sp.]|jgi:formylmethanofuran dehydrogenase subunit E
MNYQEERERLELVKNRIVKKVFTSLIHYHQDWEGSAQFILSNFDYQILKKHFSPQPSKCSTLSIAEEPEIKLIPCQKCGRAIAEITAVMHNGQPICNGCLTRVMKELGI